MKQLGQSAVGTGAGTMVYRVPTGYRTEVTDVMIANTAATSTSVKIHFVTSGGSASTSNQVFPNVSIYGNQVVQWSSSQILNAGDFIQGIGSQSGVTVTISGDEKRVGL